MRWLIVVLHKVSPNHDVLASELDRANARRIEEAIARRIDQNERLRTLLSAQQVIDFREAQERAERAQERERRRTVNE